MPELPEVETVRRGLERRLKNRRIDAVAVLKSGKESPREKKFIALVSGKKIKNVERRAKLIIFRFEDGSALIVHLKMTGRLVFAPKSYQPQKHDAVIFSFGDARLIWSDVRKFGYLRYVSGSQLKKIVDGYGIEPLKARSEELAEALKTPKTRRVKAALLDQTKIAGIGNIYADESLHRAGILPTRRLGSLKQIEREKLAHAIQNVLKEAIAHHGTSIDNYVDSAGRKGTFAELLQVYRKNGEPCRACGTTIKRITLAGRGTYFCQKCQR